MGSRGEGREGVVGGGGGRNGAGECLTVGTYMYMCLILELLSAQ